MSDSQRVNVRPGAPDDEDEGDPRRWKILGVCLAISFLTMMTVSIINVALPSITTSLSAGSLALQAMVSGYTLAFGLALVPTGRVGDAGHRRLIILISLGVFAAASVVSALATSDIVLAVARLVQGVAAGSMSPQGMGLTQQVFSWRERGRAFGFNGAIIGVSTTLGPVIGGGIIAAVGNEYGWRWIFGMTAVFALVVLGFAWRLVPADKPATGPVSLDAGGLTLISVMALALMMPFILTNGTNDDPQRWWWLVLAAACLVALYFVERRGKRRGVDTIIDLSVLGAPSFRNGTILGTVYFTGMNSIMLIVVLLLQNGMGYTALEAGLVCAPFSVGSALVAATSGRLVARYGRPLVVGGLVVTSLGIGAMSLIAYLAGVGVQLPGGIGVWLAGVGLIAGCGSGAIISPNLTLTMQNVPPEKAGVSSSMMQLGQRLGSAIGLAVSLSVYYLVVGSGGTPANGAHWTLLITVGLFCVALGVGIFDAVQRGGGPPPSDPSKRQPAQR